ncbi:MAG: ferrous iron transport protein A [Mangrovibacterium sp.]
MGNDMVSINELPVGEKGTITSVTGGYGLTRKLDVMGIRVGMEITVVSRQWMKGPVIIRFGANEVAMGYGMAGKILIERI